MRSTEQGLCKTVDQIGLPMTPSAHPGSNEVPQFCNSEIL
jgi:hypothetical protein